MKVSRLHEMETFADGDIVFREGELTRDMYVIHEGRVEIIKQAGGHDVQLAVLERGSFFGEMSLLEGLPRSATVRALGPCKLLVLRPGSLLMLIRRDPTFAFEMLQQMSRRIRELNEKLVQKVAIAEFGNRLARSAIIASATAEYRPPADDTEVKAS